MTSLSQTPSPEAVADAHAVRIASVLLALETGDAATFELAPEAQRDLFHPEHQPRVRLTIDGRFWLLTPSEADLVVLGLRLDPDIIGAGLNDRSRDALNDLVADAIEAAIRQAVDLADQRNEGCRPALSLVGRA